MPRQRLDVLLVNRGLVPSRERARALILAGQVQVNGQPATKAGVNVASDADITLSVPDHPYVGRGGLKLAHALDTFGIEATGALALDIGASTGGFTEVLIRRHLYPQTMRLRPPFVMGYDVVGEIDQIGDGVRDFQIGDRVADMTVVGSNADYRTLRAGDVARVPAGVDAAEAATLILSWTTAYQLLHRAARVQRGQRVLVHGAAGAVGQALLVLGGLAGLELWGTARGEQGALVRERGATPIDYQREDFTRVLPGGFDVIVDGVGEDGYRRSYAALKRGGLLCAIGFSASVQAQRRMLPIVMEIARLYLWRLLPGGKRACFYSVNVMRARHPIWFKEDLERLFGLLATGAIRPRVAERISFDEVAEAHRRLEAGGLEGKLVLCPDLPSRRDRVLLQPRPAYTQITAATWP